MITEPNGTGDDCEANVWPRWVEFWGHGDDPRSPGLFKCRFYNAQDKMLVMEGGWRRHTNVPPPDSFRRCVSPCPWSAKETGGR